MLYGLVTRRFTHNRVQAMEELGFERTQAGVVVTYAVPPLWGGGAFVLHKVRPVSHLEVPGVVFDGLGLGPSAHDDSIPTRQVRLPQRLTRARNLTRRASVKTRLSHRFGWHRGTFIDNF